MCVCVRACFSMWQSSILYWMCSVHSYRQMQAQACLSRCFKHNNCWDKPIKTMETFHVHWKKTFQCSSKSELLDAYGFWKDGFTLARAGLDAHVAEEGRAPQYLQAWLAKPSQGLPFDVLRCGQTKPASLHLCGESPASSIHQSQSFCGFCGAFLGFWWHRKKPWITYDDRWQKFLLDLWLGHRYLESAICRPQEFAVQWSKVPVASSSEKLNS